MKFSINDLQAKVRLQASIGPESFSISTEAERYDRFSYFTRPTGTDTDLKLYRYG